MIVQESYAVCDAACGARVPGDEHPDDWPSIVQGGRRAWYCSRACLKTTLAGEHPPTGRTPWGIDDVDRAIVEMVARGFGDKQIGQGVGRATSTVKNRLGLLTQRFGAHNRAQLVTQAHARGLIDCGRLAGDAELTPTLFGRT